MIPQICSPLPTERAWATLQRKGKVFSKVTLFALGCGSSGRAPVYSIFEALSSNAALPYIHTYIHTYINEKFSYLTKGGQGSLINQEKKLEVDTKSRRTLTQVEYYLFF
jgi:hypothetical protein